MTQQKRMYCPSCGEEVDTFIMLDESGEARHCFICGLKLGGERVDEVRALSVFPRGDNLFQGLGPGEDPDPDSDTGMISFHLPDDFPVRITVGFGIIGEYPEIKYLFSLPSPVAFYHNVSRDKIWRDCLTPIMGG